MTRQIKTNWGDMGQAECLPCKQSRSRQTDTSTQKIGCRGMLRHAAACFQTPMCSSKKRVLQHAAAAHACWPSTQSFRNRVTELWHCIGHPHQKAGCRRDPPPPKSKAMEGWATLHLVVMARAVPRTLSAAACARKWRSQSVGYHCGSSAAPGRHLYTDGQCTGTSNDLGPESSEALALEI